MPINRFFATIQGFLYTMEYLDFLEESDCNRDLSGQALSLWIQMYGSQYSNNVVDRLYNENYPLYIRERAR